MTIDHLFQQTLEANLALPRHGLITFTWGNVSSIDRGSGLVVIKPSGMPYESLQACHMVVLDLDGKIISGTCRPSSDTATHLALYRCFPEIGSITHTHSRWATVWAQAGRELPVLGTTHADYFNGPVPLTRRLREEETSSDYEQKTGEAIVELFQQNKLNPMAVPAVLVASHGPFTWGRDAAEAVLHAVVLEECAMMAFHACQLNPQLPPIEDHLLDRHYRRKHGASAYYGQKP
ncbi:MAG: L-ribulose-5-phosphate 4-epimerase [Ruminococcaceae bacterium]|nr:L-ribulose-5-phosphate 4-epimerase [Oscillospiraceae bacterium]